jgi:ElaB/YqjD/DUF883 family membrane-anchored ribosome-binding protein
MSSSTTDPGDRSSAQIEREVENTRAQLTDTLDTLRDRISPGHLMDQAVEYMRGSGGKEFASNLGRTVRDNPVPVLLIGAGLGWLMMSGGGSSGAGHVQRTGMGSSRTRVYPAAHGATPSRLAGDTHASLPHGSAGHGGGGHEASITERAREAASGAAERIGETASQAYETVAGAVGSAAESAGSAAGHVSDRANELAHDARDYAARAGSSAQQGVDWLLHEQPMVLGGIGLAIGAAIGALLPGTSAEDRMMGEASDEVTRRVKDVAHEGYERAQAVAGETVEQVKATATETYEATKDRLDTSGPSVSKVGAALGAAAQDVAKVAREGVQDAAAGARDAMKEKDPPGGMKDKDARGGVNDGVPPPRR